MSKSIYLSFDTLRAANKARLPQFKNKHGQFAHSRPDGSDWSPGDWVVAVVGELGEFANNLKKYRRGDLSLEEFKPLAKKEFADIQIYLDLLALRCLDRVEEESFMVSDMHSQVAYTHEAHPTGIDIAEAVYEKFNEVSKRVGSTVFLSGDDEWFHLNSERDTFPHAKPLDGGIADIGLPDSEGGL